MAIHMQADLIVCGAGTAGSTAAIAAADAGLRVALVEQSGGAGGSGTLGLVTPMMHTGIPGNPMCSYISDEINRRMVALGAATGAGDSYADPVALAFVLEDMLLARGVNTLYHAFVCGAGRDGARIRYIEAACKGGFAHLSGAYFLDATGDADVVRTLGLPLMKGDENGRNQPVSLRYVAGGVDTGRFHRYLRACRGEAPGDDGPFCDAVTLGGAKHTLDDVFAQAVQVGELDQEDALYWQFFTVPGRADAIAFNCPEFFDEPDACDPLALSRVQALGKRAIMRHIAFYRKRLPGFENAYVSSVAGMVGIRESRRAETEYVLTANDCRSHRAFADAIARSNYAMDVHGRSLSCTEIEKTGAPYYEIPLRSLIVRGVDNLMVAGRCLGAEFVAQSSARIMPTCRAMGEACGIAAALAGGRPLREVDGAQVRARMIERGARFE